MKPIGKWIVAMSLVGGEKTSEAGIIFQEKSKYKVIRAKVLAVGNKLTEDIKVQYDSTCRDTIGSIYQSTYGEDGINPTTTVKVADNQEICDISSIVNKLNIKHEDTLKKVKSKK